MSPFASILNTFLNFTDFIYVIFVINHLSCFLDTSKSKILPSLNISYIRSCIIKQVWFVKLMSINDSYWRECRKVKFKLVAPVFFELSLFMLTSDNTLFDRRGKLLYHWTDVIFVMFWGDWGLQGFQCFKTILFWE